MSPERAFAQVLTAAQRRCGPRIPVIGISGAQGAGKTTLVRKFEQASRQQVAGFSLDDVYLGSAARRERAEQLHPLFATRGVPGTHDIDLFHATLDALGRAPTYGLTPLPAFDKRSDEPVVEDQRPSFWGRPSVILVDGWCLGATPQDWRELKQPVNELEAQDDPDAVWRGCVNDFLLTPYQDAFARLDAILYLKAPSFDVVFRWRKQQEEAMLDRALTVEENARLQRFVAHYERITRHMLAGGRRADVVVELDAQRNIIAVSADDGARDAR